MLNFYNVTVLPRARFGWAWIYYKAFCEFRSRFVDTLVLRGEKDFGQIGQEKTADTYDHHSVEYHPGRNVMMMVTPQAYLETEDSR